MIELLLQADQALAAGFLDQAERMYWQAIDRDPQNAIAVVGLSRVSLARGDQVSGRRFAAMALTLDPENVSARRLVENLQGAIPAEPHVGELDLSREASERLEALGRSRSAQLRRAERATGGEGQAPAGAAEAAGEAEPVADVVMSEAEPGLEGAETVGLEAAVAEGPEPGPAVAEEAGVPEGPELEAAATVEPEAAPAEPPEPEAAAELHELEEAPIHIAWAAAGFAEPETALVDGEPQAGAGSAEEPLIGASAAPSQEAVPFTGSSGGLSAEAALAAERAAAVEAVIEVDSAEELEDLPPAEGASWIGSDSASPDSGVGLDEAAGADRTESEGDAAETGERTPGLLRRLLGGR